MKRTSKALTCLALLGGLGIAASAGDRIAPATRIVASTAPTARESSAALPAFTLFGWLSPPIESTTVARMTQLAAAGLNVAHRADDDSGSVAANLERLDLAAAVGVRCLIWDRRFERFLTLDPESQRGGALLDSIVADYREHPGFLGYNLGDEPSPESFALLGKLHRTLRARDPEHPAWNNLFGRLSFATREQWLAHTRAYLDQVRPALLCNDQYDFLEGGDRGQFVENAAGLAALAREYGLPFWSIVLVIEHGGYRHVTEGELRWQVSQLLAYGTRGVGYFTYWTPAPDPLYQWQQGMVARSGETTEYYDLVSAMSPAVRAAGQTLSALTWLATEHAGSVPAGGTPFAPDDWVDQVEGRAALGHFVDAKGTPHVLLASSDSSSARTIGLWLRGASGVSRLGEAPGSWVPLVFERAAGGRIRVAVSLEAGGFALLRLEGTFGSILTGRLGPTLSAMPNPARGEVRLDLRRLARDARLEVLDPSGRRVWSTPLESGARQVIWRGEAENRGAVAPGVYFVRVEDVRGVAAARLVWLGP